MRCMVKKQAAESTEMHKTVTERLMELASCTHGGRSTEQWVCAECEFINGMNITALKLQNSVVGLYIKKFIIHDNSSVKFTWDVAAVIDTVLRTRVAEFEKYLGNLSKKIHTSSSIIGKNMVLYSSNR